MLALEIKAGVHGVHLRLTSDIGHMISNALFTRIDSVLVGCYPKVLKKSPVHACDKVTIQKLRKTTVKFEIKNNSTHRKENTTHFKQRIVHKEHLPFFQ